MLFTVVSDRIEVFMETHRSGLNFQIGRVVQDLCNVFSGKI